MAEERPRMALLKEISGPALRAASALARDAAWFHRLDPTGVGKRAVLEDSLTGFEGEVQAIEGRVALLEFVNHAQALQVVFESALARHAVVERVLPGVAERRVAQVVRQ